MQRASSNHRVETPTTANVHQPSPTVEGSFAGLSGMEGKAKRGIGCNEPATDMEDGPLGIALFGLPFSGPGGVEL